MKPPLAIVGASARAAAASAVRAGFSPLAADLFADVDLRQFATATRINPYPEGLLDWLRALEPPAWMYTGALENHAELIDQMAWVAPLWGNPGDVLARVRSPWALSRVLRAAGLLFPETRASADGLSQDGTWLAKTYHGAGGSGVQLFVGWAESHESHDLHGTMVGLAELDPPYDAPRCFQRHVVGTPISAVFVAADGNATLLGVTRQFVGEDWLGAHGFQYCGSIGPWPVSDTAHAEINKLGGVLARDFELVGLFGVDMILDGEQVWTIEVNPRYTASVEIIERAAGVPAIALHAAACGWLGSSGGSLASSGSEPSVESSKTGGSAESRLQPPVSTARIHGKAILFARREVVLSPSFAEAALAEGLRAPWPTLADISSADTRIEERRPVLTIFADGPTTDEVARLLRRRVAELERTLYAGS